LVFLVDYDTMEIPNRFVIVLLYVAVAACIVIPGVTIIEHLIGAVCISVPMLLLTYAVPGAFGGGDVKLSAAVGLILGWQLTIVGFFIGLLTGGIYGIVMLVRKKKGKKEHFAFGPFLCTGYVIAAICGMELIDSYMRLASFIHG
jgi:leader peptidase (prepilin peptidase)/N-methyltransferase